MITYRILAKHRLILLWSRGETSLEECKRLIAHVKSDPEFSPRFDVITDLTELDRPLTTEEIQQMVQIDLPKIRNAIIAPRDGIYGASRTFQSLSEGKQPLETAVFRDRAAALQWLGKDPAVIGGLLRNSEKRDLPPDMRMECDRRMIP